MKAHSVTIYLRLLLFIPILISISGCGSTGRVTESDFEILQFLTEESDSGYTLQISGFSGRKSALYKESLRKLKTYSPRQVTEITESGQQKLYSLTALIANDPRSVNRVLWLFGTEIYRNHHLDYEAKASSTGFAILTSMPEMIGDIKEFQNRVRYPSELEGSGIEGQVHLQFIVNEFGVAENPEVIQGLQESADREAIRVIMETRFKPGIQDNLPVRVQIKMPVNFRER